MNVTLNADFDGDVLNTLCMTMEEFWALFEGFSPKNMIIDRVNNTICLDISPLENIGIAIMSDIDSSSNVVCHTNITDVWVA